MALGQRRTYSELASLFASYSAASAPKYDNLANIRVYSDIASMYASYSAASTQNSSYLALATYQDPHTGSVAGSATSSGLITGAEGDLGLISNSSTSTGSVHGSPQLRGISSASTQTSSTIIGIEGDLGAIVGGNVTSGLITGSRGAFGLTSGESASTGTVEGILALNIQELAGFVIGLTVSTGLVKGTMPAREGGGRKIIMEPAPYVPLRTGGTFGVSFSEQRISGVLGYPGQAEGSNETEAVIFGRLAVHGSLRTQSKIHASIEGKSVLRRHVDEELLLAVGAL